MTNGGKQTTLLAREVVTEETQTITKEAPTQIETMPVRLNEEEEKHDEETNEKADKLVEQTSGDSEQGMVDKQGKKRLWKSLKWIYAGGSLAIRFTI